MLQHCFHGDQDPRVLDAMLPYMVEMYGNPHSRTHAYGWESSDAVEKAREVRLMFASLPVTAMAIICEEVQAERRGDLGCLLRCE
jgi:cysteine sulfinate desulfinase/cysteine desulfurase-like protein